MREQLRRAGCPAPRVIGVDEIAVGKRHSYRIVVSDLERGRPIWFGGKDRSEASLDEFYAWLGPKRCRKIRRAVMAMWKAFRKSTLKGKQALKLLFRANRRLTNAYVLKESFGQLWDYNRPGWARRFFHNSTL